MASSTHVYKQKKGSFMNFYKSSTKNHTPKSNPIVVTTNKPTSHTWFTRKSKGSQETVECTKRVVEGGGRGGGGGGGGGGGAENVVEARKSVSHVETNLGSIGFQETVECTKRVVEGGGRGGREGNVVEARKSVSHVETNLASVAAFLQVKVLVSDMPGFMQVHAFRCARRTYDSLEKFSSRHMAFNIKKEFDKVYGPAWHCIVGSSFGSFVTHSTGCFLYFSMEKLYILVFKTKVQQASD